MNVLYVGSCDSFASALVNKLVKEDHTVHIIAVRDFDSRVRPKLAYRLYEFDADTMRVEKVFSSIHPDIVIFGGDLLGTASWEHNKASNNYITQLMNTVSFSAVCGTQKFIYLSSTEVYEASGFKEMAEDSPLKPTSYKGLLCMEGELLVENICRTSNIAVTSLRFADIYGYRLFENKEDIISAIFTELSSVKTITLEGSRVLYPISVKDGVEAVYRAMGNTPNAAYNVGGAPVPESKLYEAVQAATGTQAELVMSDMLLGAHLCCDRIKKDLEWYSYGALDSYLEGYVPEKATAETQRKPFWKSFDIKTPVLVTVENGIIFVIFAVLATLFGDHSVLRNVDMMYIYIILSALLFGVKQSILSVIFAFLFYMYGMGKMADSLVSVILNVDTFLQLAQYIFMGVVVGYAVERNRVKFEQAEIENKYRETEYNELRDINNDNILIKRQYEKRLLGYKTSLPRLYAITSRLDSLNPQVIFASITKIFEEVMETKTVSVYSYTATRGYARLMSSLNDSSIFAGKSFKLSAFPEMEAKLSANEVFIGNQFNENSPSMAGAVFHKGNMIAIIIIREMEFQNLNLYQISLFKTLIPLITSSLVKAYQYEEKIRNERYLPDSEILNEVEFQKLLEIKQKNREDGIAHFTLIKILEQDDPVKLYQRYASAFRTDDFFGLDSDGELCVLLTGTAERDMEFVDNRLRQKGIEYSVVNGKNLVGVC
ncbi:MAG: NAD(P)-dependent oxidoreductase [Angelakisella sp.]